MNNQEAQNQSLNQNFDSKREDELALNKIGFRIAFAAQDEWLSGQFEKRVPFPDRVKNLKDGKDGHPFVYATVGVPILVDMLNKSEGIYNFKTDLETFKIILAEMFNESIEYFDYLNSLTPEEFYSWIQNIVKCTFENNSHWTSFVKELLEKNLIDFSDLVDGKLDIQSHENLIRIQRSLVHINNAHDIKSLLEAVNVANQTGVLTQMIKAHGQWRKQTYNLDSLEFDDHEANSTYDLEGLGRAGVSGLIGMCEHYSMITFDGIINQISVFRENFEKLGSLSAKHTFILLLNIAVGLQMSLDNNSKLSGNQRNVFKQIIDELIRIIKLDANLAPIDTVIGIFHEALQVNGRES